MKYTSIILILWGLSIASCSRKMIGPQSKPIVSTIDFQGHRGARGLYPENTLPAFEAALKYNVTTLEMDTVLTKDNHLIVHHNTDTNANLCLNKSREPIEESEILDMTLAELKELDCGSLKNTRFSQQRLVAGTQLSTLEEVIEFSLTNEKIHKRENSVKFNIEVKLEEDASNAIIEKHVALLVKIIRQYKIENRTTIQSFEMKAIQVAARVAQNIQRAALFEPSYWQGFLMWLGRGKKFQDNVIAKAANVQANVIAVHYIYIDSRFVQLAHRLNLQILVWTVNETEHMISLLRSGVDGLISDYPDRMLKVRTLH